MQIQTLMMEYFITLAVAKYRNFKMANTENTMMESILTKSTGKINKYFANFYSKSRSFS